MEIATKNKRVFPSYAALNIFFSLHTKYTYENFHAFLRYKTAESVPRIFTAKTTVTSINQRRKKSSTKNNILFVFMKVAFIGNRPIVTENINGQLKGSSLFRAIF